MRRLFYDCLFLVFAKASRVRLLQRMRHYVRVE